MKNGHVASILSATPVVVLTLVSCVLSTSPATAQTFVVNTEIDELGIDPGNGRCETVRGNGICTLRRAFLETRRIFEAAHTLPPTVTIVLDVPGGVISIGARLWEFYMPGAGSLALIGAGRSSTVIDANGTPFLLMGWSSSTLRVSGLTIRRAGLFGIIAAGPARLDHVTIEDTQGRAFQSSNSATVTECEFNRNLGGAILSYGTLRLRRTILRNNRGSLGGAIHVAGGVADLDGVTFVGNHATDSGGAIATTPYSALRAVNSTFSGNTADEFGGALLLARFGNTLSHVTLSGNRADTNLDGRGTGAAIASWGSTTVTHSVVSANAASILGAGGWIAVPGACSDGLQLSGPNLFDVVDCPVTGVPPTIGAANLGPLQDNGGTTPTHLPLPGSAAIDAGQTGPCVASDGTALDRDQRGRRRNAGPACDLGAVETGGAVVPMGVRYDVNGDGKSDVLWEHTEQPWRGAWLMNGAAVDSLGLFPIDDPLWHIIASDDVDGDGKADLIWIHRHTGHIGIWLMDGMTVREAGLLLSPGPGWGLAGTGDVDGDGRADLVWEQGPRSGVAVVWFLDGVALKGFRRWPAVPGWSVAGVADANGDGTSDLLWRRPSDGAMALWFMSQGNLASGGVLPSASARAWTLAAFTDLNGDGKADIVLRNQVGEGAGVVAWLLDGTTVIGATHLPSVFHELWTLVQALDTDGDRRSDLIWRSRGVDGQYARWRMDGLTLQAVELLPAVSDQGWRLR